MIGGAPYFMRHLEDALLDAGLKPKHAFTKRRAIDIPKPDGTVEKKQIFEHAGFVEVQRREPA